MPLVTRMRRSAPLRGPRRSESGGVPRAAANLGGVRGRSRSARHVPLRASPRNQKAVLRRAVLARDPSLRGTPRARRRVPRERAVHSRAALSRRTLRAARPRHRGHALPRLELRRGSPLRLGPLQRALSARRSLSQRSRLRRGRLHALARRSPALRYEVHQRSRFARGSRHREAVAAPSLEMKTRRPGENQGAAQSSVSARTQNAAGLPFPSESPANGGARYGNSASSRRPSPGPPT